MTIQKYDLSLEFSGGTPMPTTEEATAGYIPQAALDAVGEPTLIYGPATDIIAADDTLATALAPTLRGVGLTVDASGNLQVRARPRKCVLQDYFITGGLTTGTIGTLAWNLGGVGTPAVSSIATQGLAARKLIINVTSSANDRTSLTWGQTESSTRLLLSDVRLVQTVHKFATHLATKRWFFGFSSNFATEPSAAADCLGIYYDSAVSANYRIINRVGSAGAAVDTGVAAPSDTHELVTVYLVGSTYQFYIGNTLIGSVSAAVSTAGMNVGYRVETLAGTTRVHHVAYFGFESVQLSGAADDDTFLEA